MRWCSRRRDSTALELPSTESPKFFPGNHAARRGAGRAGHRDSRDRAKTSFRSSLQLVDKRNTLSVTAETHSVARTCKAVAGFRWAHGGDSSVGNWSSTHACSRLTARKAFAGVDRLSAARTGKPGARPRSRDKIARCRRGPDSAACGKIRWTELASHWRGSASW